MDQELLDQIGDLDRLKTCSEQILAKNQLVDMTVCAIAQNTCSSWVRRERQVGSQTIRSSAVAGMRRQNGSDPYFGYLLATVYRSWIFGPVNIKDSREGEGIVS